MRAHPLRRHAPTAVAAAVTVLILGAVVTQLGIRSPERARSPDTVRIASEAARVPLPQTSAFTLGRVRPLVAGPIPSPWAPVRKTVSVRARPVIGAPAVAVLRPRTSLGTTNIVQVVGHARVRGRPWVRIRFPSLPNNATGWLPRGAVGGYHFVRTRLVIDLERFTVALLRDGRQVFRASVGVGTADFPTPRGSFYIREKLTNFDNPYYGPVAFGTSARSPVLTDWPDGGSIGIHGTNRPDLLPGRVSHGCIRLRNKDILRLSRLMPVGTPVRIT
jgi:lipoprotein-anchoring transpeptidase ErfK/SrfK